MDLLFETGYCSTSIPKFVNHSSEQMAFFDTTEQVSFSENQRSLLDIFTNVSHLFTLGHEPFVNGDREQVAFYSLELMTNKSMRSQAAYDVHTLLHPIIGTDATVILAKHDDYVMLTLAGYGQGCILSDWYSQYADYDKLVELMHIANTSLKSVSEFFFDLIYNIARRYYIYSISNDYSAYWLLPIDFLSKTEYLPIDRKEYWELIKDEINSAIYDYGDDYVDLEQSLTTDLIDVNEELELMLLDMPDDDNNPSNEELDEDENDINGNYDSDNEVVTDKYLYDHVDPKIFDNPILMVKWLRENS